jgi:transposase InsO family protein
MAKSSTTQPKRWAFKRFSQHRNHPWQNAYVERLMGSIRRECLDHVIVFNESGLRRILREYFKYYERCRTHLSLEKDAPAGRPIEPPALGRVIEIPQVGGLHHRYTRKAA